MKSIRELCKNKVWIAIQHMIDGLKKASNRPDFIVDMKTFGYFEKTRF